jgi:DNA (cytosine-5)-methyltransferase 1
MGVISSRKQATFTSLELCAGAGGQALGLEQAGFKHEALVEMDPPACETLRLNRPNWNVLECDIRAIKGRDYAGVDLMAGGVPCPPFSVAGKRLGASDGRNLFPEVLRLARECKPKAVMVENVAGLMDPMFTDYREAINRSLRRMGFAVPGWKILNARDFGVPQLRPRVVLVALRPEYAEKFEWPEPHPEAAPTVGEVLYKEMASRGWRGAKEWKARANQTAPTLVGGSRLHGGPDLGPTRAREAWAKLRVDGRSLANEAPTPGFRGMPKLTVKMTALIQGFPPDWEIWGKKTPAYRQVGNAFPPPVARAVGTAIRVALGGAREESEDAA